jgi:hypothetical protein
MMLEKIPFSGSMQRKYIMCYGSLEEKKGALMKRKNPIKAERGLAECFGLNFIPARKNHSCCEAPFLLPSSHTALLCVY